jgi:hypothetical protein
METTTLIAAIGAAIAALGFLGLLAKLRSRLIDEGRLQEYLAARKTRQEKRAAQRKAILERLRELGDRLTATVGAGQAPPTAGAAGRNGSSAAPAGNGKNGEGTAPGPDGVLADLKDISQHAKEKPGEVASLLRSMMKQQGS